MTKITAKQVKELRDMTGVGMMDAKKALVAVDGDRDKAVDYLRENGMANAAKKAGKEPLNVSSTNCSLHFA